MVRKKKFSHDYGLTHIYKFYKEKYNYLVNYKTFSLILKTFNGKIIDNLYKGSYISLPYSLGDLFIFKYKMKFKFDENGEPITQNKRGLIDYKATNELWKEHPELTHKKRVLYDNFHTDRYKFRISWRRYSTIRVHKLYNFIAAREFKRGLAAHLRIYPNQNYYDK